MQDQGSVCIYVYIYLYTHTFQSVLLVMHRGILFWVKFQKEEQIYHPLRSASVSLYCFQYSLSYFNKNESFYSSFFFFLKLWKTGRNRDYSE